MNVFVARSGGMCVCYCTSSLGPLVCCRLELGVIVCLGVPVLGECSVWVLVSLVQWKLDAVILKVSNCFSVCSPALVWCDGGCGFFCRHAGDSVVPVVSCSCLEGVCVLVVSLLWQLIRKT